MSELSGDNKAWIVVAICVMAVLITITTSITYYNIRQDEIRLELVNKGVDPLTVECLDTDLSRSGIAAILCFRVLEKLDISPEQRVKLKALLNGNGQKNER